MRSALLDGDDVMDFLDRGHPSLPSTSRRKRLTDVPCAYSCPGSAVLLMHVRAALVPIVPALHQLFMLIAILAPFHRKLRAIPVIASEP